MPVSLLLGEGGHRYTVTCVFTSCLSLRLFFLIFRKSRCLWQELMPAVMHSPQSCSHPDARPWYGYCLTGFTVLTSTPLCVQCCPANAPFLALLWLQQAFQCVEFTRSDHWLDHANIIISDYFFLRPNSGTFLDFSGLFLPEFFQVCLYLLVVVGKMLLICLSSFMTKTLTVFSVIVQSMTLL